MPRVLVVDDSRIVRATIAKHVKNSYDVREAADGEDGWEALLADDQIRAVISDLSMPRLDGFGLIERIRGSDVPRVRNVPIIMISGDDEAKPRQRASALGATAFITKGVGGAELLARLGAVISQAAAAPAEADVPVAPVVPVVPATPELPVAAVLPAAAVEAVEAAALVAAAAPAAAPAEAAPPIAAAPAEAAPAPADPARVPVQAEAARVVAAEQAVNDALTGLLTMSALIKQGAQLFAYARRHQLALSVMRVVLDDFDLLRGKTGDGVADQILVGVSKLLNSRMRKEDCVARTGPGEFAVALPAATRAGAARLAERLTEEIRQAKITWQGQALKITASVGVADTISDSGESFADIYGTASKRALRAHAQGGGQVAANDVTQADLDAAVRPAAALSPAPAPAGLSIDQALRLLAEGRGAELEVHVPELARAVYPLVKFCDEMFEKASANRQATVLKAAELLMLKTQPMDTLKQRGFLE